MKTLDQSESFAITIEPNWTTIGMADTAVFEKVSFDPFLSFDPYFSYK